ncbi:unnamed protein product [Orchesella dallaii]|uniref:Odorant receptor n=1 Tax=Orchesella dallaii TaxID=48710 RepID=A0ABP1R760_9HEXA
MSNQFISDFRTIFTFYILTTTSPVSYSHLSATIYAPEESNKYVPSHTKQAFYYFTRSLLLINFIQVVRLLILNLWELHVNGSVEMFGLFSVIIWTGALTPVYCNDFILLKENCLKSLFRSVDTCVNVLNRAKEHLGKETMSKILLKKSCQIRCLMFHNLSIYFISIMNCMWSTYENIENDPTMLYQAIPWKNQWVDVIYWFILQVIAISIVMFWSLLLTFPGVVAYHFECVIMALTKSVEDGPTSNYPLEAILKDYRVIEFGVRDLHQNGFSKMLIMFLAASGIQLVIESFCVFQMIKHGVSWDVYQLFLLDAVFSLGCVFHELYALSRVDLASQMFFNSIQTHVTQQCNIQIGKGERFRSRREPLFKKIRLAKHILMRIGPLRCKQDLLFTSGSVYMDCFVSSALWP